LPQEKQAEMLKDPNVARAILQTLEGAGRPGAAVLDGGFEVPIYGGSPAGWSMEGQGEVLDLRMPWDRLGADQS